MGEVPRGWRIGSLVDIAKITMGQSPPGESYNEAGSGLPFYQGTRDFGWRFPKRRVYCTQPTRYAEPGDVLLSVRAPVGHLNIANERCAIGRGLAALRHLILPNGFLYYLLRATQLGWAKFEAEGTVFGSASKNDVTGFPIIIPDERLVAAFGRLVEPIDALIEVNEREMSGLASIRDTLLPKLMSGELRLKNAQLEITEAPRSPGEEARAQAYRRHLRPNDRYRRR